MQQLHQLVLQGACHLRWSSRLSAATSCSVRHLQDMLMVLRFQLYSMVCWLCSEKDLDEVLQTTAIFANVGKGIMAAKEDLQVCWQ
jgi:hypothetical protein